MSPTATIASLIVALVFFAWLFQSDTKDPNYQAFLKRQEESRKSDQAQKAAMGIQVTDAGVTKDNSPLEFNRNNSKDADPIQGGSVFSGDTAIDQNPLTSVQSDPTTRPLADGPRSGFAPSTKLNGTYIRVDYVGDSPAAQTGTDVPSITFRRDGTFATQNMAAADVDMEPGTTVVAALDRGSGRYKLSGNNLDLTYTDGLNRHKGPHRSYVVAPVGGAESAPTAITIQGKIFKLDANR